MQVLQCLLSFKGIIFGSCQILSCSWLLEPVNDNECGMNVDLFKIIFKRILKYIGTENIDIANVKYLSA